MANKQIPENAALYIDLSNEISGSIQNSDPEENLIDLMFDALFEANRKNLKVFVFDNTEQVENHIQMVANHNTPITYLKSNWPRLCVTIAHDPIEATLRVNQAFARLTKLNMI